jgi:hypothetical protein
MTADYNGWNDLPEAEREALDEADEQMALAPRARSRRRRSVYFASSWRGLRTRAPYREARSLMKSRSPMQG